MTKILEYAIISGIEYTEDGLNDRGKEGWELCTIITDHDDPLTKIYYFKREISEDK